MFFVCFIVFWWEKSFLLGRGFFIGVQISWSRFKNIYFWSVEILLTNAAFLEYILSIAWSFVNGNLNIRSSISVSHIKSQLLLFLFMESFTTKTMKGRATNKSSRFLLINKIEPLPSEENFAFPKKKSVIFRYSLGINQQFKCKTERKINCCIFPWNDIKFEVPLAL